MTRYFGEREIPGIGLGTWENEDFGQCRKSVRVALETGYRHVDTAQFYGNEEAVGAGIAAASVDREDLFVATKVWIDRLGYDGVVNSTEASLNKLGLDYVDCLYVHWPSGEYRPEETFEAFEELLEQGKIKAIGVSNFTVDLLEEARQVLDSSIFANQVEMHPLLQQRELRNYQADKDVWLVAYSPFRHGTIFEQPELKEIASAYGVSVAQVVLAWQLEQENVITIPKATGVDHIKDNFRSMDLELDSETLERIDSLDSSDRYIDPPIAPWQ